MKSIRNRINNTNHAFNVVNFSAIVNDVVWNFQILATEKNVSIKLKIPDNLQNVKVETFETTMLQAIFNIVNNAFHAVQNLSQKAIITIEVTKNGDFLTCAVSDNGPGISEENIDKLFKKSFTTKGDLGTGNGLMLTKKYIGFNRGEISLDREYRKGAKFNLKFPILKNSESEKICKTFIIVDDERDILDIIESELSEFGNILITSNVRSAFDLLKKFKDIDLIISDFKMPDLTGLDFYHMVREINQDVPFIIFTGIVEAKVLESTKHDSHFKAVTKPDIVELTNSVKNLFENSQF